MKSVLPPPSLPMPKSRTGLRVVSPRAAATRGHPAGFTFIEVMIAMAILIVIGLIVYMLLFSSTEHSQTHATGVQLENDCRIILDQISRDLREADANSITMPGSFTVGTWNVSTSLQFAPVTGFNPNTNLQTVGPVVTWATAVVEGFGADGADNNSDGMIDESEITRTQSGAILRPTRRGTARWPAASLPVSNPATEPPNWPITQSPPAIFFARENLLPAPPVLHVRVTLQGVDSKGRRMMRSASTKIHLRN